MNKVQTAIVVLVVVVVAAILVGTWMGMGEESQPKVTLVAVEFHGDVEVTEELVARLAVRATPEHRPEVTEVLDVPNEFTSGTCRMAVGDKMVLHGYYFPKSGKSVLQIAGTIGDLEGTCRMGDVIWTSSVERLFN